MKNETHSEYSAQFQMELLQLDPENLKDPILVLGCGTQGNLVHTLKALGHAVCGIDPNAQTTAVTRPADFLTTDYGNSYWETILSPLAFSREVADAVGRKDGSDLEWVKCYKKLLNALKPGGSFIYAPSLSFLEDLLPKENYQVVREVIRDQLMRTKVTRL